MADTISPAMAFGQSQAEYYPPQATVSLSETSLEDGPVPATPESMYIKDEDDQDQDDQEEKKPTKKRKSWGQELPTPKTNLPPRYALPTFPSLILQQDMLTMTPASVQRLKMKRSNVASSASSEIAKPLNPLVSESDKRWKSSKARNQPSSDRMSPSRSD